MSTEQSTPLPPSNGETSRIVAVIDKPLDVRDLTLVSDAMALLYGEGCVISSGRWTLFEIRTPGPLCWCAGCEDRDAATVQGLTGDLMKTMSRFMILCPECGNKRCPRASDHTEACTGSNDPGQVGSRYGISRAEAFLAEAKAKRKAASSQAPAVVEQATRDLGGGDQAGEKAGVDKPVVCTCATKKATCAYHGENPTAHDTYAEHCRARVPGTPMHGGGRCALCESTS